MKVVTTNLAIRFYAVDGWTEKKVLALNPDNTPDDFRHFDAGTKLAYWVPHPGTKIHINRLMEVVTAVQRTYNDYPWESDQEHLARFL